MVNFWSRALIGASLAGALASCSSVPDQQPVASSSVEAALATALAVDEPVPQFEPPSRSGNPDTYVVFGRRYRVKDSSEGYRETGTASWYGWDFHGRKTSSGPPFNMFELSAAHKSLPIPTYVRVTNLENGRSIVVKVNDRGPFIDDRAIDLSYAAAARLDMLEQGTAQVEIVALAPYQYLPDLVARRSEQRERQANLVLRRQEAQERRLASLALRREEAQERRLASLALRRERAATIEFAHEAPVAGRASSRLAMANVIRNSAPLAKDKAKFAERTVAAAPSAKAKVKPTGRVVVAKPVAKDKGKANDRVVVASAGKGRMKSSEHAEVVAKGKAKSSEPVAAAPVGKGHPPVRVASVRSGRSRIAAD